VKNLGFYAVKAVGVTSLALLLTSSAFAESRHQDQTNRRGDDRRTQSGRDDRRGDSRDNNNNSRDNNSRADNSRNNGQRNGSYRDNDRVTLQGRVTSFSRENNGYRVNLDRGGSPFWVPESYFRNRGRGRDLRVGVSISLGGIFRRGSVYVDAVNWPDDGYGYGDYGNYGNDYVSGVVDRVDFRRATVWLRDARSGRLVEVDMRSDRNGRLNLDDLRRGDYVELSGGWARGDIFVADRIESVRNGRY
jgi:hypothetical protein